MADRERIVDRIIKLFRLGTADRNNSEAEVEAAVTKARILMAEHDIQMADIEMKTSESAADRIGVIIQEHTAYTRKIANLAPYDFSVADAVATLTSTRVLSYRGRGYTRLVFIGTTLDTAVASELFLVLLQTVRRLARQTYGSRTWDTRHTSFALGCGSRLIVRARDAVRTMTPIQQECTALIVRDKMSAITQYIDKKQCTDAKPRRTQLDGDAYRLGYEAGRGVSLGTRTLKSGAA